MVYSQHVVGRLLCDAMRCASQVVVSHHHQGICSQIVEKNTDSVALTSRLTFLLLSLLLRAGASSPPPPGGSSSLGSGSGSDRRTTDRLSSLTITTGLGCVDVAPKVCMLPEVAANSNDILLPHTSTIAFGVSFVVVKVHYAWTGLVTFFLLRYSMAWVGFAGIEHETRSRCVAPIVWTARVRRTYRGRGEKIRR